MSKRDPRADFHVCGCIGSGKSSASGYYLSGLTEVLDRMNGQPPVSEIKPEPEDDRHWVRQVGERAEFPREEIRVS